MPTSLTLDLSDQVVAVTGASSGIGEEIARLCANAGASVALGARRVDRIEALQKEIRDEGGKAIAIPTDVTDEDEANHFIATTIESFGRVDALINNAGVMLLGPVTGAPTSEWREMLSVNVMGLLYCTHAVLPHMAERGGGHIVNISSLAGRVARSGAAVYNLTKFGVTAFSEALRQEVIEKNIRVTAIEPGLVNTELLSRNRPEIKGALEQRYAGMIALHAVDIANAVVYAITQPDGVSVNEILIRPTTQGF